jgi:hypothetical protein
MSIKPYFWSKTASDDELDELKAPLPTLELTLEPTKPVEPIIPPIIKYSRRRL